MDFIKDKYERIIDYIWISITDRCNLRCIYCMPPEGIRPIENRSILSYEEITRVVRISASLGVRKIRLLCDFVRIEVNRLISDIG